VIDAKSDIVILVTEFNGQNGYIKLKHLKRRGGRMLEFGYAVELVPVYADKDAVPLITGRSNSLLEAATEDKGDKLMKDVLLGLGNSATSTQWRNTIQSVTAKDGRKGWSDATFDRRLKEFKKRHPELTGGRFQGDPYSLGVVQPTGATAEVLRTSALNHPHHHPHIGSEGDEGGLKEASRTLNPPSEGSEGGSSQGRAEGQDSPALTDEYVQMMRQLDRLR
jgi:hypothetical protein